MGKDRENGRIERGEREGREKWHERREIGMGKKKRKK